MKAILEFDLPDDQDQFNVASRAMNWALVVWALDGYLRDRIKYTELPEIVLDALEDVRDHLFDLMSDYGVTFDDFH